MATVDEVMEMNKENKRSLLCLDLEGTLISNAVSQIPRPGLYRFLERASVLCDLMLYTSVSRDKLNSSKILEPLILFTSMKTNSSTYLPI